MPTRPPPPDQGQVARTNRPWPSARGTPAPSAPSHAAKRWLQVLQRPREPFRKGCPQAWTAPPVHGRSRTPADGLGRSTPHGGMPARTRVALPGAGRYPVPRLPGGKNALACPARGPGAPRGPATAEHVRAGRARPPLPRQPLCPRPRSPKMAPRRKWRRTARSPRRGARVPSPGRPSHTGRRPPTSKETRPRGSPSTAMSKKMVGLTIAAQQRQLPSGGVCKAARAPPSPIL